MMLHQWLLSVKTILFITLFQSVYTWNPQCSPCRCFEGNTKKISDCSSSVSSFPLTKIPDLRSETETVFLVGQQLQTIPQDAFFRGSTNSIKFVDLKNCKVRTIHANAFRNLKYLSGLDLAHNELSQLDENVFGLNNNLKLLLLQNNNLKVFPEKIFNSLPSLKYLDLSDNKLHYIHPNQFKSNINLHRIILQSNYLTRFDYSMISNLPNLNVLYLDNNPWKCDCQTKDLQKFLIDRKIDFIDNENYPVCSKPTQWKGNKWLEVNPKDLCSVDKTPSLTVSEGDNFDVDCQLDTSNYITVEWLLNGQSLDTSNSQKYQPSYVKNSPNTYLYKLRIKDVKFADIGVYKCWTSNLKGSDIQYEETVINVQPGIKPTISGPKHQNELVKNGERNYKLPCDITSSPAPKVEWLFNGNALTFSEFNCKRQQTSDNALLYSQLNPSCFGNYTCRATNPTGVAEKTYEILVLPQIPPKVNPITNIDNNDADESSSVSLNCYVSESIQVKMQWLRNGEVISPNNKYGITVARIDDTTYNYILTINGISYNEAGNYKCSANSVESPDFKLNIKPNEKPTISGPMNQDKLVKNGDRDYKLPCDITGSPKPKVEWLFNGKILTLSESNCKRSHLSDNALLYSQINPACFGKYTCRATNSKGVAEKNYDLLVLPQKPPKVDPISNIDDNNNAYDGTSISLNCVVSEPVEVVVQWLRNGEVISPNNRYTIKVVRIDETSYNYILTISDISFNEGGFYKCRANTIESPGININIKPSVGPTINDFENQNEISLEPGDNKNILCKATGTPKPTISWKLPSGCNKDSSVQGETLYLRNVDCSGRFKCIVTNSKGSTEKEFNLSILKPTISQTGIDTSYPDTKIFEYDDITLKCLVEDIATSEPYWEFNNKRINSNNNKYNIVKTPMGKNKYYYNLEIKSIALLDRGNYKCRVGSQSQTVDVNVQPATPPSIVQVPDPQTYVEAGTKDFRLECRVVGSHPNVVWTFNKENYCKYDETVKDHGDYRVAVLVIKEAYPICQGQYKCKVNNVKGIDEKVVNLKVVEIKPPTLETESNSIFNKPVENEDIILKCLISGAIQSQPRWEFDGALDPNKYKIEKKKISETSYWYNLVIKNLKLEDGKTYKCVIGNQVQSTTLNVIPSVRPNIEYISNTQTIEAGRKNFRIACKATGAPKPKTSWLKSGTFDGCNHEITREINGNNETIYLTIPEVTSSCSGRYTCVASSSKGEEKMDVEISVVSIDAPPVIDIETLSIDNQVIENEEVTLKCLVKTNIFKPEWIHQGQVIRPDNKYRFVKVVVNQTAYWYNLVISKISPREKGSYKCRINNFENEILINIQESKKPIIEHISNPDTVEEGKKDFTLSCKVNGIPKPKVYWHYEGQQITKQSSNQLKCKYTLTSEVVDYTEWLYLTIRNVELSCAGKYKCVADNLKGEEENEINLSIVRIKPPEIIETPKNVFENSNVTLQCLIKGSIDSKPIWLHNNRPIDTNRNNKYKLFMRELDDRTTYMYNLEIINISPYDKGNYKCKINNLETEVTLKTEPSIEPQIVGISRPNLNIEEGAKEVTLICQVIGTPTPEITWLYENIPIDQISNNNYCRYRTITDHLGAQQYAKLTIRNIGPTCAGKYKCLSKNLKGSDERDVNVVVSSIPPPFIEVLPETGNQVVEKEKATLRCLVPKRYSADWYKGNNVIVQVPNGRYEIEFNPHNDTSYWHNLVISDLSPTDKGEYKCKINNIESIVTLDVLKPVKPTIEYISTKDNVVSEGAKEFKLACKVTGVPKPQVTWQYKQNNCKHETYSEANGNSEWIYLTIAEVTSSCSGTYKCVTTNSAGTTEQEINLSVSTSKEVPEITVTSTSPDGVIRENDNVTLRCLSTGPKAKWYFDNKPINIKVDDRYVLDTQEFNPMTTWNILTIKNVSLVEGGTYSCRVNNAEETYNLEIERALVPTIEYLVNPKLIVDEDAEVTVLPCKVTDSSAAEWYLNGRLLHESSCPDTSVTYGKTRHFEWYNLTIPNITTSCSGQYKCIVRNLENIDNNGIDLTVLSYKPPKVDVSSNSIDETIREQDSVTLKCLITSSNTDAAKWIYRGKVITSDGKNKITKLIIDETSYWYNLEIPSVSTQQSGIYKCSTDRAEIEHILTVLPGYKPIIELTSNVDMIVEEGTKELTLFCKAKGSPAPTIKWSHPYINSRISTIQSRYETNSNTQLNYLTIKNLSPSCSGRYICIASNSKGNAEQVITLTVIPTQKPEVTINSTSPDNIIREGDDVTFSCLATGKNNVPTKWFFKSKYGDKDDNLIYTTHKINPLTNRYDVVIRNITFKQSGTYSCSKGAVQNNIEIDVQSGIAPKIEQFSNSENIVIYTKTKETILVCKVSGTPRPEVNWFYNDIPLEYVNKSRCKYEIYSNDQWNNLIIKDASSSCSGNYKCVARNIKDRTEKQVAVRVIQPETPEIKVTTNSLDNDIKSLGSNDIIKENDKVTLRCLVKGDINNTPVFWLHNEKQFNVDNKNHKIIKEKQDDVSFWYNLQIERISVGNGGNYQCRTSKSKSSINIKVQSTTRPTVTIPTSPKVFVQTGKELILSCLQHGVPIPSSTWEYNNNPVDKISQCSNSCQYKLRNVTNMNTGTGQALYLTITNISDVCSGKYKCIAQNSAGKAEKFVEVVVIPPEQPKVQILGPVHAILHTDVTIPCEVTSVDLPSINWKYFQKIIDFESKYVIKKGNTNNLHYSNLTIVNFQRSDFGDYTCAGKLHNLQNIKTISLKDKMKFKPRFINPNHVWENFKIIGNDIVLVAKVKSYPQPKLEWKLDETTIHPDNTKYISEISYINDDQYWFNQTIKNFDPINDVGKNYFIVRNEIGIAKRDIFVNVADHSGRFGVVVTEPEQEEPTIGVPVLQT